MGSIKKRVEALAEIYESERFYLKDIMTWKQLLTFITSDFTDEKKKKLVTIEMILEDLKKIECTNKILFILLYDKIVTYLKVNDNIESKRKLIVEFAKKIIKSKGILIEGEVDKIDDKNIEVKLKKNIATSASGAKNKQNESVLANEVSDALFDQQSSNTGQKYKKISKHENKSLHQSQSGKFFAENEQKANLDPSRSSKSENTTTGKDKRTGFCSNDSFKTISESFDKSKTEFTSLINDLISPQIMQAIQDVFLVAFNYKFPIDLKKKDKVDLEFLDPFYFLISHFDSYLLYLQNLPRVEYEFEKQMSLNPKLKDFINEFLIKKNLYDLGIKNLLFRPSMKIVRYSGLLKAVAKNHDDFKVKNRYNQLIENLNYVSKILDNEIKKRADMFNIYSLYNRFNFSKLKNKYALGLIYENTRLLKEGKIIVKLSDSDPASYKNIYIFNRFILICQTFSNNFENIFIDDDPIFLSKLYLLKNLEGYKTDINLQSLVPLYLIQKANKKVVALYFEDENTRNVYFSIIDSAISKVRQKMDGQIKIYKMKVLDGEINSLILSKNSFGSFLKENHNKSVKTLTFSEDSTDDEFEDNSSSCSYGDDMNSSSANSKANEIDANRLSGSDKTPPDFSKEFQSELSKKSNKIKASNTSIDDVNINDTNSRLYDVYTSNFNDTNIGLKDINVKVSYVSTDNEDTGGLKVSKDNNRNVLDYTIKEVDEISNNSKDHKNHHSANLNNNMDNIMKGNRSGLRSESSLSETSTKNLQVFVLDEKSKEYYSCNNINLPDYSFKDFYSNAISERQLDLVHKDFSSTSVGKLSDEFNFETRPSLKTQNEKFFEKNSNRSTQSIHSDNGNNLNEGTKQHILHSNTYDANNRKINLSLKSNKHITNEKDVDELIRLDREKYNYNTVEMKNGQSIEGTKNSFEITEYSSSYSRNRFDFSNFGKIVTDEEMQQPEHKDLKYKDIFTPEVEALSRDAFYLDSEFTNYKNPTNRGFCYDLFKKNTLPWSVIEIENELNSENIEKNEKMVIFSNSEGIFKVYQGKTTKIYDYPASKIIYDPEYEIIMMLCEDYVHMAKLNYTTEILDAQIINTEVNDFFCGKTRNIAYIALVAVEEFSFNVIHLLTLKYSVKEKRLKFSVIRKLYVGFKINNIFFLKGRIIISCKDFEIIEIDTLRTQELLEAYDTTLSLLLEFKDYFMANSIFRLEKNSLLLCFDGGGYLIDSKGQFKKENVCFGWETIGHTFKIYDRWIIVVSQFYVSVFEISTGTLVLCEYYPGVKIAEGYNFPVFYNRRSVFVIDFTGKELKAIRELGVFEMSEKLPEESNEAVSIESDSNNEDVGSLIDTMYSDHKSFGLIDTLSGYSKDKIPDVVKGVGYSDHLMDKQSNMANSSNQSNNLIDKQINIPNNSDKSNNLLIYNLYNNNFPLSSGWESIPVEYFDSSLEESSEDQSFYIYHSQDTSLHEKIKEKSSSVTELDSMPKIESNSSKNSEIDKIDQVNRIFSDKHKLIDPQNSFDVSSSLNNSNTVSNDESQVLIDLIDQNYLGCDLKHKANMKNYKNSKRKDSISKLEVESVATLKSMNSKNKDTKNLCKTLTKSTKNADNEELKKTTSSHSSHKKIIKSKKIFHPIIDRIGNVINERSLSFDSDSKNEKEENFPVSLNHNLTKSEIKSIVDISIDKSNLYIGPPSLDLKKIRRSKSRISRLGTRKQTKRSFNVSVFDIILEYSH